MSSSRQALGLELVASVLTHLRISSRVLVKNRMVVVVVNQLAVGILRMCLRNSNHSSLWVIKKKVAVHHKKQVRVVRVQPSRIVQGRPKAKTYS